MTYPETLEQSVKVVAKVVETKLKEYEKFFGIPLKGKIKINFFDNYAKFINFTECLDGCKNSLPNYGDDRNRMCQGIFSMERLIIFANPKFQMKKIFTAPHELFHLLYRRYTYQNDWSKRFVWYDEGMAVFMSGQMDHLKDENKFFEYYARVRQNTKTTPNMSVLHHGPEFINENYNGYDLGYLAIRYLHETLSSEEFKALYADLAKIETLGTDIVEKMFQYYDAKLASRSAK